jgi:hypothetical protein
VYCVKEVFAGNSAKQYRTSKLTDVAFLFDEASSAMAIDNIAV